MQSIPRTQKLGAGGLFLGCTARRATEAWLSSWSGEMPGIVSRRRLCWSFSAYSRRGNDRDQPHSAIGGLASFSTGPNALGAVYKSPLFSWVFFSGGRLWVIYG